ncbi:class I SAM-dependent DNA methyltransferase [Protofrankia symbiont of Coriaria ruscifolia]|uniref:class I SAM-dependent DNA methyltransferase n=1 Tax=Protofrankia symbiont of Coriaria ruscifolia TaxID=1306542 RepID=UPI001F5F7E57|nr:class I SAM-dependent methyltransferase [Protofrankia symbiont of Coriaria ruscifolia]
MPGHPDPVTINTAVWERHARARIAAGDLDTRPAIHRFRWTRTGVDDPGAELLGDIRGKRVVELGCGTGDNLAYLVDHRGARGVGIDAAPSQIRRARARWSSPVFHCTDAALYLATCEPIDVCYSVFGAVGLCPPAPLLARIRDRLRPGGWLVFSVWDSTVAGGIRLPRSSGPPARSVHSLASPDDWTGLLRQFSFTGIRTTRLDRCSAPDTLLITGRRSVGG